MEKAKAYIKNELRGGTLNPHELTSTAQPGTVPISSPSEVIEGQTTFPENPHHPQYQQLQQYHHQRSSTKSKNFNIQCANSTGNGPGLASAHPRTPEPLPLCFVCGGQGGYESIRVRANPECPNESFFPFLERHEPPNGVPKIAATQMFVMACYLCFRSLNEQWDAYERKKKPYLQRIYHMKRVDGKNYIGADVTTQGEYAAQMLGLSAEHLAHSGLEEGSNSMQSGYGAVSADAYQFSHAAHLQLPRDYGRQHANLNSYQRNESPHTPRSQTDSPSPAAQHQRDSYDRMANAHARSVGQIMSQANDKLLSSSQSQGSGSLNPQLNSTSSLPPSVTGTAYENLNIKPSSFAHHKLKLGQIPYMNSISGQTYNSQQYPQTHSQKLSVISNDCGKPLQHRHEGMSPHNATAGHYSSNLLSVSEEDSTVVLDLRNSAGSSDSAALSLSSNMLSLTPTNCTPNIVDVGILDLSMPDKNSTTEVCYVCGDEQRRGSLIELSTVKPKESKDRSRPYFLIFNEQHPRPARSRPKDPRGMIQACRLCYDYLIQQWNNHQTTDTPENDRIYSLRKPATASERTTFVCYTCGCDTLSSKLYLVYCCPNAEREPYYPFIKTMKAFKNASPISPQGMVQVCSSCYEKHSHMAEGGSPAVPVTTAAITPLSISGGIDNGASYSTIGTSENVITSSNGAGVGVGGRYTPSEKSLANSDSTSNVRFRH